MPLGSNKLNIEAAQRMIMAQIGSAKKIRIIRNSGKEKDVKGDQKEEKKLDEEINPVKEEGKHISKQI